MRTENEIKQEIARLEKILDKWKEDVEYAYQHKFEEIEILKAEKELEKVDIALTWLYWILEQ